MKIGPYKITGGPNWSFFLATGFFAYLSYATWSVWPILGWLGFCIALIPICFSMARWDQAQEDRRKREREEELESMKELFRRKPGGHDEPRQGFR